MRWLREGARGGGEHQPQEVRGLRPEGAKLRAAGRCEETAVVRWLREGARGGGEHQQKEVLGLWPEAAKLRVGNIFNSFSIVVIYYIKW